MAFRNCALKHLHNKGMMQTLLLRRSIEREDTRMATFYYGGQAVMEGVMMRGRRSAAMAIRRPDDSIYIYEEALNPRLYQNRIFRLPFLRGMLLLWEMLVLGTRLMTLSANLATGALDPHASAVEDQMPGTRNDAANNRDFTNGV